MYIFCYILECFSYFVALSSWHVISLIYKSFSYFFHLFAALLVYTHRLLTMAASLTCNVISLLMDGSTDIQPILQIVAIDQETTSRYCLTLSDGLHRHETLLLLAHNELAMSRDLQVGSIIRLKKCRCVLLKHLVYAFLLTLPFPSIAFNYFHSFFT